MSYQRLAALALAAITLTAAGCGSSKSETTTTTATTSATAPPVGTATSTQTSAPPSHTSSKIVVATGKPLTTAQWIAKGDAICGNLGRELQTLKVKVAAELPRVLPQAAAYERDEVAQLEKLVPPRSKVKDWKKFLTESLQWAEGSAEMAESVRFGDSVVNTPIAKATFIAHAHVLSIAGHQGFKVCSS
jgi:hypothetical protein